ncbi:MAG: hypothetical protein JRF33_06235 [Deltaproteobacteria bacterium]|nr:hypothetical protein [Deltaproteobacteria bacterium]
MEEYPRHADLEALLEALAAARIELIVVGGAAAVLHGAPVTTQDLDIVHQRTPENVARLMALLEQLDAVIRDPAGRRLRPTTEQLMGAGQLNLATALGPFDPLCQLHDGRDFEDLLPHTVVMSDGDLRLRVIDLDTLIEIKTQAGRAKDRLMLPVLIALQQEKKELSLKK